jgi:hypothetical protein
MTFAMCLLTSQFLRTSSFTVSTFLSVLLTTDASSAQVTLLLFLENHWKNVCSSHFLLYKVLKIPYYFFSSSSKMWCRHTVVQSVQLSRYAKITNGTARACS